MTWLNEIWTRSGRQFQRLGGFLLAALVIGFGVEWLATSNARMILVQPAVINDLALSPDGEVVAIAYANGIVELRETGHSRRLIRRIESRRAPVMDLHLDDVTEFGLRLTMARADGRLALETALEGQRLSDDLTFTRSLLTPQFKVARDGTIWAHGINEQGAWIGRLEPGGNYAQPVGMSETGSAKMTLLSATSERAHLISDTVHTIWAAPIEQTNSPTDPEPKLESGLDSSLSRATGTPGIIERVPLGDGYVTLQDGHVMTAMNGAWRTATEFFDESRSANSEPAVVEDEIGGVTIYGGGAQGDGTTASGEILNSNALTAAHRTLPFGTQIEVTNLSNDQSVVLRVNDRGPFEDGMVIGVTAIGAMQLGLVTSSAQSGPPQVRVRVLGADGETSNQTTRVVEQLETSSRELVVEQAGPVAHARYSNSGELIATATDLGTVTIWRSDTFAEVATLEGHSDNIWDINFSPDDSRLVTTSENGDVRVWSQPGNNGWRSWQAHALEGHTNLVRSATFSPDGSKILTASDDFTARVWTQNSDDSWQSEPLAGHTGFVSSAAFSPDGSKVVTASYDSTVRVWTLNSEDSWQSEILEGHSDSIRSAEFSPNGSQIVTASDDFTARVWTQNNEGRWQGVPLEGHTNFVRSAAFSPDGSKIVTDSIDRTARVWTQNSEGNWRGQPLIGHTNWVNSAAFSPDGARIVTASRDLTVRVWTQTQQQAWESALLEGHSDQVSLAAFSPDGTRIVSASADGTARIWTQARDGRWQLSRTGDECRSDDGVGHLQRSALGDPRSLWMWSKDTWLCELSFEENMLSWSYALPTDTTAVKMLAPWQSGPVKSILVGRANGTIEHRDVQTDRLHAVYRGHGGPITQIETVDMDGTLRAAIAAADGSVQIIDLPNKAPTLFAKTNTDVNGFIVGLNKLRGYMIQSVIAPDGRVFSPRRSLALNREDISNSVGERLAKSVASIGVECDTTEYTPYGTAWIYEHQRSGASDSTKWLVTNLSIVRQMARHSCGEGASARQNVARFPSANGEDSEALKVPLLSPHVQHPLYDRFEYFRSINEPAGNEENRTANVYDLAAYRLGGETLDLLEERREFLRLADVSPSDATAFDIDINFTQNIQPGRPVLIITHPTFLSDGISSEPFQFRTTLQSKFNAMFRVLPGQSSNRTPALYSYSVRGIGGLGGSPVIAVDRNGQPFVSAIALGTGISGPIPNETDSESRSLDPAVTIFALDTTSLTTVDTWSIEAVPVNPLRQQPFAVLWEGWSSDQTQPDELMQQFSEQVGVNQLEVCLSSKSVRLDKRLREVDETRGETSERMPIQFRQSAEFALVVAEVRENREDLPLIELALSTERNGRTFTTHRLGLNQATYLLQRNLSTDVEISVAGPFDSTAIVTVYEAVSSLSDCQLRPGWNN